MDLTMGQETEGPPKGDIRGNSSVKPTDSPSGGTLKGDPLGETLMGTL